MLAAVNGVDLYYEVVGTGVPVFVVGLLQCDLYRRALPEALSSDVQLIFVELRGSGRSNGDPAELAFDTAAADLEALRVELGFERVAVFGHAIHGLFATAYASRYPATTSHLVLTSTPALVPDVSADEFWRQDASPERRAAFDRQIWSLPEDVADDPFASSDAFILYRTVMSADAWYDPNFDATWLWEGISASPALLNRLYNELAPGWDAGVALSQVRAPMFAIVGRFDYRIPYSSWLQLADSVPGLTVETFHRSGHWAPIEQPDQFANSVAEFIAT